MIFKTQRFNHKDTAYQGWAQDKTALAASEVRLGLRAEVASRMSEAIASVRAGTPQLGCASESPNSLLKIQVSN